MIVLYLDVDIEPFKREGELHISALKSIKQEYIPWHFTYMHTAKHEWTFEGFTNCEYSDGVNRFFVTNQIYKQGSSLHLKTFFMILVIITC